MLNLDYKLIKCPKCGKMHFKESGTESAGSVFDFAAGFGWNDCVFRVPKQKIYKDGVLENPQDFIPEPQKTYFECLDCGCHFSVERSYEYVGGDIGTASSDKIIDEDKARLEREEAWQKQVEERKKKQAEEDKKKQEEIDKLKAEGKIATLTCGDSICVKDDMGWGLSTTKETLTQLQQHLGKGNKSEIDLGGVTLHLDKTFTEEQIKNIRETFGWGVKNEGK